MSEGRNSDPFCIQTIWYHFWASKEDYGAWNISLYEHGIGSPIHTWKFVSRPNGSDVAAIEQWLCEHFRLESMTDIVESRIRSLLS